MKINFDLEKLRHVLNDFCIATGINITIIDEYFVELEIHTSHDNGFCRYTQKINNGICRSSDIELLNRCKKSGKIETKVCPAGLTDICVPIFRDSEIICYLLYGQIRTDKQKRFDDPKLERLYSECRIYTEEQIKSIISVSEMLARYILFENMVTPVKNTLADALDEYIKRNIGRRITINEIANGVGCSTSALYGNIRKFHGKTPGKYITDTKLEYASRMLLETDLSMEQISLETGFSSAQYFSKMFKKRFGISPLKYRKSKLQ